MEGYLEPDTTPVALDGVPLADDGLEPVTEEPPLDLHEVCNSRIGLLETERNLLRDRVSVLISERAVFNAEVRQVGIEAHKDNYFCLDGLNDRLRRLGLDEYHPRFRVTGRLGFIAWVTADSAEEARRFVESGISVESGDDIDDREIDDFEVRSVEEEDE